VEDKDPIKALSFFPVKFFCEIALYSITKAKESVLLNGEATNLDELEYEVAHDYIKSRMPVDIFIQLLNEQIEVTKLVNPEDLDLLYDLERLLKILNKNV
jgi:hypothetical protein